jgi:hypothetical protein
MNFFIVEPSPLPILIPLCPIIRLKIMFSNILSLHSSLNVRDHVSQPYSTTSNMNIVFWKSRSLFLETSISCEALVNRYVPEPNPTRALYTTSIKCCFPLTDAIDRREKFTKRMMVQGQLLQVSFIDIHQV